MPMGRGSAEIAAAASAATVGLVGRGVAPGAGKIVPTVANDRDDWTTTVFEPLVSFCAQSESKQTRRRDGHNQSFQHRVSPCLPGKRLRDGWSDSVDFGAWRSGSHDRFRQVSHQVVEVSETTLPDLGGVEHHHG